MTAFGRLWRRAPAWRFCLIAGLGCTGLAAMFPPGVPHWPGLDHLLHRAAAGSGPRYVPPAGDPAPPAQGGTVATPPLGSTRQGIIPFAGRQVVLPAGTWQELAIVRAGPQSLQLGMFARIEDKHLTGLFLVSSPGPVSGAPGQVGLPDFCVAPDRLAGNIEPPAPGQSPLVHECWGISEVDMTMMADPKSPNEVLQGGLARLGGFGVAVPSRMLAVQYDRSSETGWCITQVFLPDAGREPRDWVSRVQAWAKRYVTVLNRGFDGSVTPADLTPNLVRDPAKA